MSLFRCQICLEKDARIRDKDAEILRLLDQIATYKELAFPPPPSKQITYEVEEFDRLLSGSEIPPIIGDHEIAREADLLLSGNYDGSQQESY
jgi:hypothetical protein